MSVAGVMLVKDEVDVIGFSLPWLLDQVDHVIVADNGSTDGTLDILHEISEATGRVDVIGDGEVAYNQDVKTTRLAQIALAQGHEWVVPCDADEFWRTPWPDVPLGDALDVLTDDILFVTAALYDHKATGLDPEEADPRLRQGWRFVEPSKLPKVACRLHPSLRIGMGNHEATMSSFAPRVSSTGNPPTVPLLVVEHYSWRSADQFCNPPEAPIWMADYTFKSLGDVVVGDEVVGFGRVAGRSKVSFMRSRVLAVSIRESAIIRVEFASGRSLRCTPDHLWWQPHYRFSPPVYKEAKVGRSLGHVIDPSYPVEGRDAWLAGWLAGIYDGEGHDQQIAQSQSHNPELYERICLALDHFGFSYTRAHDRIHFTGGRDAYVRFMNLMRPTRRTGWREKSLMGGAVGGRISTPDRIVAIEPDGYGEVLGLTTTTGNYVAWGYASKNCRKIRNGALAYLASDLPDEYGAHWRAFGHPDDEGFEERCVGWFNEWAYVADPTGDPSVGFFPFPFPVEVAP